MQTEANTAAPAPAGAEFVHTPRPADVPDGHPRQRYFGAPGRAAIGIVTSDGTEARVLRWSGEPHAEVGLRVGRLGPSSAQVTLALNAAELRELARRLIDAAADIEADVDAEVAA